MRDDVKATRRLGWIAIGAAALAASCAPARGADLDAGVVALVDGEAITASELREAYWASDDDVRARASRPGGRHYLLDQVIADELLLKEARARGLAPRYSELQPFHQRLMARFLAAELDPTVRPEDVPEAVVRAEYDRLAPSLASPHRRHLRVLMHDAPEGAREMIATAEELVARAGVEGVTQGIDDGTLRTRYGQDGLYTRETAAAELGEQVAEAAFALDAEVVVVPEPIPYRGRWGVVIVREDFDAQPAPEYEAVADQIRGRVQQEARERALDAFVDTFRGEHRVELHPENVALIPWVVPDPEPSSPDAGGPDREAGPFPESP